MTKTKNRPARPSDIPKIPPIELGMDELDQWFERLIDSQV